MDRSQRLIVERLFQEALDRAESERESFLEASGEGPEILAEVRALLAHHQPGNEVFQFPSNTSEHPERIGPFEIQELLGEGGMGIVYRATQTEPVRRPVALKLVKLGMGSKEILDRFEHERQTLAQLRHSNIAAIYEAGISQDGRPYFAMEYVDGEPINRYCDRQRLTPRERVELLVDVCRGVQEAHQRGVIHRDLKPSNILVATEDERPIPKIIDFGVAKATDQGAMEKTRFTQFGQLIGTPEYMSPEQAEGGTVDTRSDIYSLGVILYELLAGVLPLGAEALRSSGFTAMMRMIREEEPSRPSTRVSTLGDNAGELARRRRTNPRRWVRSLRGELDWIALKALEKEPRDRYASVGEFAADLHAHLSDEPVRARPSTGLYTLRKFARRHRVGVMVGILAVAGILVFTGAIVVQSMRIARERDRANLQSGVAQQVTDFMADVFVGSDPGVALGDTLTARQLLDRGVERMDQIEDPQVRAELLSTLAGVYQSLSLYERARPMSEEARELFLEIEDGLGPRGLSELNNYATIVANMGFEATAESLCTVAIEGWRALGMEDDSRALDPVQNRAISASNLGRWESAAADLMEVAESRRARDGDDDPQLLTTLRHLAQLRARQERYAEAAEIYEDVVARRRRVLGDDHPETITTMAALATTYVELERFEEAEELLAEAVERSRRVLGEGHTKTRNVLDELAYLYFYQEKYEEAAPIFLDRTEYNRRTRGAEHPGTLTAMFNLASVYGEMGRNEEAGALFEEVLAVRIRILGEEHPYTQQTRYSLGIIAAKRGDFTAALEQFQIAVDHGFAHTLLSNDYNQELLAPLHGDPRFVAIQDTVRARLQARGVQ